MKSTNLFKLAEISIGYFAIVEADEDTEKFPYKVHGFLTVLETNKHSYYVLLRKGCSDELKQSGEIESLKESAIELTEEAIADETL